MPNLQSSYLATHAKAIAGMIADMVPRDVISRTVQDVAGIGFGKVVYQGTADRQITATPSAKAIGITVIDPSRPVESGDKYAQYDEAAVLIKGAIWVTVSGSVVAGDPAYRTAGNAFSAASSGNTALANARFETSAANGELAVIRLR